jgi:hypothetical protein
MAQASTRSSTKGRNASSNNRGRSGAAKSRAKSGSSAARSKPSASAAQSARAATSSNSSPNGSKAAVVTGVATAAAGLVGGVVLGTRLSRRPKKVLGIKVPGSGSGLDGVAKQVKKAGKEFRKTSKQVGELTDEVRAARRKAEEVGRAIS